MKNAPRSILAVVLSAALVSGCATPQIVHNPNTGQLATNDLKLALVLSDKTRESVKRFHELARASLKVTGGAAFTGDYSNKPFEAVNEILKKDFSEVTIVDSAEQAKASGADMIAVLDYKVDGRVMSMTIY